MQVEWKTTENHRPPERSQWATKLGPYHAVVTGDTDGYAACLFLGHGEYRILGSFPTQGEAQLECVTAARRVTARLLRDLSDLEYHLVAGEEVEPSPAPSEDAPAPETFPAT